MSLFFQTIKMARQIARIFMKKIRNLFYQKTRKNEVINFVKSGLKDLSGKQKIFPPVFKYHQIKIMLYTLVPLDALTNYISALNYPNVDDRLYNDFLSGSADLHMIGKDVLRFHAVYWPAFLLVANLPTPKRVYGHGWILSGEEKMSKSKGNILDPLEIINEYGLDALRYYLLKKEVSFVNDGSISKEKLISCINSDLANNFAIFAREFWHLVKKIYLWIFLSQLILAMKI